MHDSLPRNNFAYMNMAATRQLRNYSSQLPVEMNENDGIVAYELTQRPVK